MDDRRYAHQNYIYLGEVVFIKDKQLQAHILAAKANDTWKSFTRCLIILCNCRFALFKEVKPARIRNMDLVLHDRKIKLNHVPFSTFFESTLFCNNLSPDLL